MDRVKEKKKSSADRSSLLWIIGFLLLMAFFYWLDQNPVFQEAVVTRLSRWTARGTVFLLGLLGIELNLAGTTVTGPAMRLEIAESCSGTFVFLMFAAAVIPFPAPLKARLKGLLLGLLTLLLINLVRTSLIVLVVSRFPGSLWTFHIVIGQILVIAAMMGVFLWWAKNAHEKTSRPFFGSNRAIFRFLLLFSLGYASGYALYQVFLESPLGHFINGLIEAHMKWVLTHVYTHLLKGDGFSFTPMTVKLVEGCLKSPIVVLVAAIIFAWPAKWWKRLLVIFLGFIPFFYGYHLIRVILVTLTLGFQTKEGNLVYNLYGQVFLMLFLLGAVGYYRCTVQKSVPYGKYLWQIGVWGLMGLFVAYALSRFSDGWFTPWLLQVFSGRTALHFDPEWVISTMLPVWALLWVVLIGATPAIALNRKIILMVLGVLTAAVLYGAIVALFETFNMAPHKGLLKLFVIILPAVVYGVCCLRSGKEHL